MDTNLIKIAFCYFTNEIEKDFLKLSLQNLTNLIKRNPQYECKIFVIDDLHNNTRIKLEDLNSQCVLKHSTFKMIGIEGVEGIFNTFGEIYNNFKFDYVVMMKEDCMLNYVGFIDAITQRLKKQGGGGTLSQVSKVVGDISTIDWQCFSLLGVKSILNILNCMTNTTDSNALLMRKRVRHNPYTNSIISYLLEMTHASRINIDYLEGIKSNVNYFDKDVNERKENYLALTFKSPKVDREKSLKMMQQMVEEPFDDSSDFIKLVKGKRVAVVGNGDVNKDYSDEIDSADVVIRFNNFYNYQSNKVGKRVDALVLTGTSALHDKLPGGKSDQKEIIQAYLPKLYLLSEIPNQVINYAHSRFNGCEIHMLGNPSWMLPLTSGTIALRMLADCDDVKVNCYGFSDGEDWDTYNKTYNIGHKSTCHLDEYSIRIDALRRLKEKTW
jgi:hypothetical protein